MAKWTLKMKGADYASIGKCHGIDPLIARILRNRDIVSDDEIEQFLHGDASNFVKPWMIKDMDKAATILRKKIEEGAKIRVIGDYDADGVCAAAILIKGIRTLGGKCDGVIPHRVKDGYGLNESMVEEAYRSGVDTIVTCDNGISAYNEVQKAKDYGMTVIVTDHHEVPFDEIDGKKNYIIPPADVVVDPKRPDMNYEVGICGAFVAYKLMSLLLPANEYDEILTELLQYAAIATVTDIMELKGENRVLVKEGLKLLSNTRAIGLSALISVLGLSGKPINNFHLGFVIGPCINAAGRIDSADRALKLFLTDQDAEAMEIASELKDMNDSRKVLTEEGAKLAISIIEESDMKEDKVLVVYLPNCHESVVGIIAGRIKERYCKPTFIVTDSEGLLKGSGRSIEAYNMYEEMTAIKEVFTKFGGHSQAAGFSLEKDKLEDMRERLNRNCTLTTEDMLPVLTLDADAPFSYCSATFVEQLDLLEPCGNGNPSPLFARKNVELTKGKIFGNDGKVGKYQVRDVDGFSAEVTLFMKNYEFLDYLKNKFGQSSVDSLLGGGTDNIRISIAYYPKWNEYKGVRSIQFIMEDYC